MTLLIFRTETTAIPNQRKKASDASQPRIMQISAMLFDKKRRECGAWAVLIQPEGWIATAGASEAHGITQRRCETAGIRVKAALAPFFDFVRNAAEIAAFDLRFHSFMIDVELAQMKETVEAWGRPTLKRTCIKTRASTIANAGVTMNFEAAHLAMVEREHVQRIDPIADLRAIARLHFATIDRSF